jgi:hypothetical protein
MNHHGRWRVTSIRTRGSEKHIDRMAVAAFFFSRHALTVP